MRDCVCYEISVKGSYLQHTSLNAISIPLSLPSANHGKWPIKACLGYWKEVSEFTERTEVKCTCI